MELTGKCKEEFEKWFLECYKTMRWSSWNEFFNDSSDAMRFGVFQQYFDSVGLNVSVDIYHDFANECYGDFYEWDVSVTENFHKEVDYGYEDTRQEAQLASIEKANELRNKQLNETII